MTAIPFTFPVDVTTLPPNGREYDLAAKPEERAAVARALGLESLNTLTAHLVAAPAAGGTVTVTGSFAADAVQACVVTLAPVPAHLQETIERRFAAEPSPRAPKREPKEPEAEGWVDPEEEVTDPLVDGMIDLGEIVTEQLSLALNPYPRAPGATFTGVTEEGGRAESPFAALAALKVGKAAPRRGRAKTGRTTKKRPAKGKTGG